MKKLLTLLVFLATPLFAGGQWYASGTVVNPADEQLIVDSGQLVANDYSFCVIAASDVASVFRIEHRNAANDTTLRSQLLPVQAASIGSFCFPPELTFTLADNERLRVVMDRPSSSGTVSVSIFQRP